MAFAELNRQVTFTLGVVKCANIKLVTSVLVAHDSLVLVRMIEPLNSCVTLLTFNSFRAQIPPQTIDESFTIFWCILEQIRRSPEISGVMCEITTLRVMGILLGRTPACLVVEHEEDVAFFFVVEIIEVLVQVVKCQEAIRNEIIFDAFVLKVSIYRLNVFEVLKSKWNKLIRLFVLVVCDHEWSIEPVMTEEFEFLRVIVPSQCLF